MSEEQFAKLLQQIAVTNHWLAFVLAFLGAGLGALLGAYLKRKGENWATKQDIGAITRTAESIQHDFGARLEVLRADLQVSTTSRADLHQRATDAAIETYEKCWAVFLHYAGVSYLLFRSLTEFGAYLRAFRAECLRAVSQCMRLRLLFPVGHPVVTASSDCLELLASLAESYQHECLSVLLELIDEGLVQECTGRLTLEDGRAREIAGRLASGLAQSKEAFARLAKASVALATATQEWLSEIAEHQAEELMKS